MTGGEPIPGQSGPDQRIVAIPNAEPQKVVRVTGDEFDSPQEKGMDELCLGVTESLKQLPPNVPGDKQSNEFWDTVSILQQPDVTYGDVKIYPSQPDVSGVRRSFERIIFDQSGKEVGRWKKRGFVTPDGRLASFSESVEVAGGGRETEKVAVHFDEEGNVYQISQKGPETQGSQEINYRYVDGEVSDMEYVKRDETGQKTGSKNKWFSRYEVKKPSAEVKQSPPQPVVDADASARRFGKLRALVNKMRGK